MPTLYSKPLQIQTHVELDQKLCEKYNKSQHNVL